MLPSIGVGADERVCETGLGGGGGGTITDGRMGAVGFGRNIWSSMLVSLSVDKRLDLLDMALSDEPCRWASLIDDR